MPDPLEALLRSVGEVLAKLFGNVIEWLTSFFKNVWLTQLLLWGLVWQLFEFIMDTFESMWDYMDAMKGDYGSAAFPQAVGAIQFVNTILPITEMLAFLAIYFVVVIACCVYSFFKALVPGT